MRKITYLIFWKVTVTLKYSLKWVFVLFFCLSSSGCMMLRFTQIAQATTVVDAFYNSLLSDDVSQAISYYSASYRVEVGDDLLMEGLSNDQAELGSYIRHEVIRWQLGMADGKQDTLTLFCRVYYSRANTLEVITVMVGGDEKIISHELDSKQGSAGYVDI